MLLKAKSAVLHFIVSAVVLSLVFLWVAQVWYPGNLMWFTGAGALLLIMLVVDVLLGPLCTFAVYNPKKASLRFDLSVIVSIQLAALAYGVFTLWDGRPAYLVYNVDRISVVTAAELNIPETRNANGGTLWYPLPQFGPKLIGAELPSDPELLNDLTIESALGGRDLPQLPQYYVDFDSVASSAGLAAKELHNLGVGDESARKKIDALLLQKGVGADGVGYLPVQTGRDDFVAILNRNTGEVLGFLDVAPPW